VNRKSTTRKCLNCSNTFHPAISEVKRGNGKFCSLTCVCHYRNKYYLTRTVAKETKVCKFCKKQFLHRPYKGPGKFCSPACYYNSLKGKQPWHPQQNIRRKLKENAFSAYGEKCQVCGYTLSVDVHHLVPRSQNGTDKLENIAVLCPNHHREYHIGLLTKEIIRDIRKQKISGDGRVRLGVQNN